MQIKKVLTQKDFIEMSAIEAMYYSQEYITDWQDSYDWYLFSPDTVMACEDQGHIVGFMNLFPISDQFYEVLLKGEKHDGYLDLDDVLRVHDKTQDRHHLFLSCVAVHPDYRQTQALNVILAAYRDLYMNYVNKGAIFESIITHNVTQAGSTFSQRMGFLQVGKTSDDSSIAVADFDIFMAHIDKRTRV